MNLTERIKKALNRDFNTLYQKEFTYDWQAQRAWRFLEIEVMEVENLEILVTKQVEANRKAIFKELDKYYVPQSLTAPQLEVYNRLKGE